MYVSRYYDKGKNISLLLVLKFYKFATQKNLWHELSINSVSITTLSDILILRVKILATCKFANVPLNLAVQSALIF